MVRDDDAEGQAGGEGGVLGAVGLLQADPRRGAEVLDDGFGLVQLPLWSGRWR